MLQIVIELNLNLDSHIMCTVRPIFHTTLNIKLNGAYIATLKIILFICVLILRIYHIRRNGILLKHIICAVTVSVAVILLQNANLIHVIFASRSITPYYIKPIHHSQEISFKVHIPKDPIQMKMQIGLNTIAIVYLLHHLR